MAKPIDAASPNLLSLGLAHTPTYCDAMHASPRSDGTMLLTLLCSVPSSPTIGAPLTPAVVGRVVVTMKMAKLMSESLSSAVQRAEALSADESKKN